jgi:hypothetical protein
MPVLKRDVYWLEHPLETGLLEDGCVRIELEGFENKEKNVGAPASTLNSGAPPGELP